MIYKIIIASLKYFFSWCLLANKIQIVLFNQVVGIHLMEKTKDVMFITE